MLTRLRTFGEQFYERVLVSELSDTPTHVAVIQDGNRRYARKEGEEKTEGHREGAETTEALLNWCDELDIQEVTLYAFSTENFQRPRDEREALFDLIEEKLYEFADADRIHNSRVRIRAIGEREQLPKRVQSAIEYAEHRTNEYERLHLNIALAYGGRAELLEATRTIATRVDDGELSAADVDVSTVESALYDGPSRDVDLIVRSGGDERTSNFLPWQANGNEAAVYFSAPYWPEFRKLDFLRSIRTYEHRERSWRQTRARRAKAVISALGPAGSPDAQETFDHFQDALPGSEVEEAERDGTTAEPAD